MQGIAGIGIVNATEVVQAFTGSDGLTTFKDWLKSPDAALVSAVLARCSRLELRSACAFYENWNQLATKCASLSSGMLLCDKGNEVI